MKSLIKGNYLMIQEPEVGDTILIEATVILNNTGAKSLRCALTACPSEIIIEKNQIKAVLPGPPRIGNTVWWDADPPNVQFAAPTLGGTLLYIHQADGDDRKWGIVAFRGDRPKSILFSKLRKVP